MPRTLAADERPEWVRAIPYLLVHLATLSVFFLPFHWYYPVIAVGLYFVRMFFLTAAYHRYFAHRTYKTSRVFQFILALGGATCTQQGALWWAAHHRDHHKFSDTPDDVHSPRQMGFNFSHRGWFLARKYRDTDLKKIRDFARYPELVWLNRYWLFMPILLAGALYAIGGLPMFIWGYCVSTVLLWEGTFTINSLSHKYGKPRYKTGDDSKNNWLLAIITLGEGWHNNHHHYAYSTRQGFFWWEYDVTFYVLKLLSFVGLVWDIRGVPEAVKYSNRVGEADASEPADEPAADASA